MWVAAHTPRVVCKAGTCLTRHRPNLHYTGAPAQRQGNANLRTMQPPPCYFGWLSVLSARKSCRYFSF